MYLLIADAADKAAFSGRYLLDAHRCRAANGFVVNVDNIEPQALCLTKSIVVQRLGRSFIDDMSGRASKEETLVPNRLRSVRILSWRI